MGVHWRLVGPSAALLAIGLGVAGVPAAGIPAAGVPAAGVPAAGTAPGKAPRAAATWFVRVLRDFRRQPRALETAIVSYRSGDTTVDLVSAIHVADSSYYALLDQLFGSYDTVLFELIADDATEVAGDRSPRSAVGGLQLGLTELLGLDYQLSAIDYGRDNFVHADLSPAEFWRSMAAGGESFVEILARMIAQASALEGRRADPMTDLDLLRALLAEDRALELKRLLSVELLNMDALTAALDGPAGSTLIARRNERALAELDRVLDQGRERVAIFYGAGHMPDLERRLLGRGFEPASVVWLEAWGLAGGTTR